jgi:membrane associated rhomboid family serine protease
VKILLRNFVTSMPFGARLLLFFYAFGFPLAWLAHQTRTAEINDLFELVPALVWRGEVWRCFTYAFLPNGIIDWVVSLFWLATLLSVVARNWSGREAWSYFLLTSSAGAVLFAALNPGMQLGIVGNAAFMFGLLAAWDRLYARERLILLGIGEISVRQAALLIALVDVLILFFCLGWRVTITMLGGGALGWLYLILRGKSALNRRSQTLDSERIARLEL